MGTDPSIDDRGVWPGAWRGRRGFLGAAVALGAGFFLPLPARAQGAAGMINRLRGTVTVNGAPAATGARVAAGDRVLTGTGSEVWFTLNGDAFFLRQRSELQLERRGARSALIAGLRLVTGALGATFARGEPRSVIAPNITIGIRGTGVYVEVDNEQTYSCTCFGSTEIRAGSGAMMERVQASVSNHFARRVPRSSRDGMLLIEAPFERHTSEEMIELERLAGRPDPFARR